MKKYLLALKERASISEGGALVVGLHYEEKADDSARDCVSIQMVTEELSTSLIDSNSARPQAYHEESPSEITACAQTGDSGCACNGNDSVTPEVMPSTAHAKRVLVSESSSSSIGLSTSPKPARRRAKKKQNKFLFRFLASRLFTGMEYVSGLPGLVLLSNQSSCNMDQLLDRKTRGCDDFNYLDFRAVLQPSSGSFRKLTYEELQNFGFQTSLTSQIRALRTKTPARQRRAIPLDKLRPFIFLIFNMFFFACANVQRALLNTKSASTHKLLENVQIAMLITTQVAFAICFHSLNRKTAQCGTGAYYIRVKSASIYVNPAKILKSIGGFFVPIILYSIQWVRFFVGRAVIGPAFFVPPCIMFVCLVVLYWI